jgi:hypothetical protein
VRVERPVRNVDAAHAIDESALFQLSRRQPLAPVPLADTLANLRLGDLEGEDALGPDRRLDLLVVDERR